MLHREFTVTVEADITDEAMEEIINAALWHLSERVYDATEGAWEILRDGAVEYDYTPEEG